MTYQQEIAALLERIRSAATDCEGWRASGVEEKYIEAFDMVQALQKQLVTLLQRPR